MPTDVNTAERIARIETNLERIATVLESAMQDHERRLRAAEEQLQRQAGVLGLIKWLGAPLVAAVLVFVAKFKGG